jgi:hypothetical protein
VLLLLFHSPIWFVRWTVVDEARVVSGFLMTAVAWDFLWFILNPAFGWAHYTADRIWWFRHWAGPFPVDYYLGVVSATAVRAAPALLRREPWRHSLHETIVVLFVMAAATFAFTLVVTLL